MRGYMGEAGEQRRPLLSPWENRNSVEEIDEQIRRESGLDEIDEQRSGNIRENGFDKTSHDFDAGKGSSVADEDPGGRLEHLITILGEPPAFDRHMPIDPFRNKTWEITGLYNWTKTVLLVPLLLARVAAIILVLFVGLITTKVALAGYGSDNAPLSRWRRHMMFPTRCCSRIIMFCFGFHWIHRIGRPAPREVAPIVVSNHVTYIDSIFFFWELLPVLVSSTSHDEMFLVGNIIRAMQVITVDRFSSASRRKAADEVKTRAANDSYPRVLLFPEGTTTNGRALISYRLGAFRPGLPVQPAVIRYPFVYFDISWGDISAFRLLLRTLTQFTNHMEVEYLPVVYPTKRETESPELFAARVHYIMATALNVPETEHAYGDLMLAVRSSEFKLYPPRNMMVEMGRMERLYHLETIDVAHYMDKFIEMDSSKSGYVTKNQFLEALDIPVCAFSEKIFLTFDKSEQGFIDFREFVGVLGFLSSHKDFSSLIRWSFEGCNVHHDGYLTKSEMEDSLRKVFPEIPVYQVEKMFQKFDLDRDGVISWEEFHSFLKKNPELLAVFVAATSRL